MHVARNPDPWGGSGGAQLPVKVTPGEGASPGNSSGPWGGRSQLSPTMATPGKDPVWSGPNSRWGFGDGRAVGGVLGKAEAGSGPARSSSAYAEEDVSPTHFAAQVAAAAAAAVAQPTGSLGRRVQLMGGAKAAKPAPDMNSVIQKAQQEAERRNRGGSGVDIQTAQSQAARLRGGPQEINEMIRKAQMTNVPAAKDAAMNAAMSSWSGSAPGSYEDPYGDSTGAGWYPERPQDLMGTWIDMQGNSVLVYNVDAWELNLLASLSRPTAQDLQLSLRPTPDGSGWICGNATLDHSMSSNDRLHWLGPNGRLSVWVRGRQ